jgi:hypothetical protein
LLIEETGEDGYLHKNCLPLSNVLKEEKKSNLPTLELLLTMLLTGFVAFIGLEDGDEFGLSSASADESILLRTFINFFCCLPKQVT